MSAATNPQPVARDVEAQLLVDGFRPGLPPQIGVVIAGIDRRACARCRCGSCNTRGLEYRPFHRGNRYRVLAACPSCNFAEER